MTDKTETLVVEGWMAKHALQAFKRILPKVEQGEYYIPPIAKQLFPLDKWITFSLPPVKVRVEIFVEYEE